MIAVPRRVSRAPLTGFMLLAALLLPTGTALAAPTGTPTPSLAGTTSTPTPSPAGSPSVAAAPAGAVTATVAVDCSGEVIAVSAHNTTAGPVRVGAFLNQSGTPAATLDLAAGGSGTTRVDPGAGPFQLEVRRLDTGDTVARADGSFPCPQRQDLAIRVRSGVAQHERDVCAVALFLGARGPLHGTVVVRDSGFVYTSVAGYTGPDRFDYQCLTSEATFGTVRVTVLPAAAPVPTPPPAPSLPATGTGRLPVLVAGGVALVGLGALGLWISRRPRRPGELS